MGTGIASIAGCTNESDEDNDGSESDSTSTETDVPPPEFSLVDIAPEGESVELGERFEISAQIQNTGGEEGTAEIHISVSREIEHTGSLTITPGRAEWYDFEFDTSGLEVGSHRYRISVDDTEESSSFMISRLEYYSDYVQSLQEGLEESILIAPEIMYVEQDNRLRLNYITDIQSPIDLAIEVGNAVGIFLDEIAAGMDPIRLDVNMLEMDGEVLSTYHIKEEWAREYQDGEIELGEVSSRAIETAEVYQ